MLENIGKQRAGKALISAAGRLDSRSRKSTSTLLQLKAMI